MSQIYQKAVDFANAHIKPYSKKIDENAVFPTETFKALGETDFLKLMIPKELGGLGGNILDHAEICLAFASECATAGLCYMMHNVALNCVMQHGSDEIKAKIAKEVVEEGKFLALAYSELGSGTHFYKPELEAKFLANGVSLTGIKSMVTSATHASYYLVVAPSENGVAGDTDNWMVPLDTDGMSFSPNTWQGLGMRGNVSCQMHLKNASLDRSLRLGGVGEGGAQIFNTIAPLFLIGLASVYSGLCENILRVAGNYAKERKYGDGTSLSQFETVQIHLSDLYVKTKSAVALVRDAGNSAINGDADAALKIFAARINASKVVIEIGSLAMRIGGGKSYNKGTELERLLRDAYAGQVMAPSVDVLTIWLGKAFSGIAIP